MINKDKMLFALIMGCAYALIGVVQTVTGISKALSEACGTVYQEHLIADTLFIPADIIAGLILILIGSVFLYGVSEIRAGVREGIAYVYVGIILSLIFGGIYVLAATGELLEIHLLKNAEYTGWTLLDTLRPEIYMGMLSLLTYLKWKDSFEVGEG
ncbi:MAG: hypothetical protein PWR29_1744 [Methanolobus sp.]|nr:hypothetical protein [Methanolobus sp.]MDK2834284.1 hypothetical protein [Methanolobus sp.]MDK2912787.1 hypothetical protein [Methanolobus sp.]MDN5309539.1 hypothetical protein [Methanolobus sp.]